MYDIFYVSRGAANNDNWQSIKSKYPAAQKLENVKTFNDVKSRAFTKMFWVIWDDVVLNSFDILSYKATKWDDIYVHVFKNGEYFDGICLFPKSLSVSSKEFDNRFFVDKKEIEIVASTPRQYDRFVLNTYDEYLNAVKTSTTDMFWCIWRSTTVLSDRIFNTYFSYHNVYDRSENHVFKSVCNDQESFMYGIVLCSKKKIITKREFDHRYLINKKEYNIVASRYSYPVYKIDTYNEYKTILETETEPMFWAVWPEIEVKDTSIFEFCFDPVGNAHDYDRGINHVFQHEFRNELTYNGLMLMSVASPVSPREIEFRHPVSRKEHDRVGSSHKPYDIVFISYNEPNADENYNSLLKRFPRAKRVHGVKGIHNAHIEAAKLSETHMFWVVDGDAELVEDFNFSHSVSRYEKNIVHVWKSKNPINDLIYGYGGVKLLPRELTLKMDVNTPDMTTSISKQFKAMPSVSNITKFNTDEFSTWRSAFRECVKLSSKVIERQDNDETLSRLNTWCTSGKDKPFGEYAIRGALAGKAYGEQHKGNPSMLQLINNFDWLKEQYEI